MTQLILIQANFLQNAIRALLDLFKDIKSTRKETSEAKKTISELSKLSDADLRDIGLTRGDIRGVAYKTHDATTLRRYF
jgi:uncharacterized protein YjiS (DUF1127 family)